MKRNEESHGKIGKFCHFFNNGKNCPFEEIGCKFQHTSANRCRYDRKCTIKLCQFQHSASENTTEIVDTVNETSDKNEKNKEISEKEDKYKKYKPIDIHFKK